MFGILESIFVLPSCVPKFRIRFPGVRVIEAGCGEEILTVLVGLIAAGAEGVY